MAESFLLTSGYLKLGKGFPECSEKYGQKPQVSCVLASDLSAAGAQATFPQGK